MKKKTCNIDKSLGEIIGDYCRIFVGGLNKNIDEAQLRDYFEKYGEIEKVTIPRDTYQISRGFGFVSFKNQNAWEQIQGKSLQMAGRMIKVKKALTSEQMADSCKIFVGGLNWNTTDEHFYEFFLQFGEIKEASVQRTKSGESRGFGFVVFANCSSLDKCIGIPLKIDGYKIDIRAAHGRNASEQNRKTRKIFIGGLSQSVDDERLKEYFSQFGSVSTSYVRKDLSTNRSRGFGYVSFDSEETVEKVVAMSSHIICGKKVEVKKAVPKQEMDTRSSGPVGYTNNNNNNYGFNQMMGMFNPFYYAMAMNQLMGMNQMSANQGYAPIYQSSRGGRGRLRQVRRRPYSKREF